VRSAAACLPAALREQIALALAAVNACEYCLSAHAAIGAGPGLDEARIDAAANGTAPMRADAAAIASRWPCCPAETRCGVAGAAQRRLAGRRGGRDHRPCGR
jgi:AhpD family alkylhydroperoxidase